MVVVDSHQKALLAWAEYRQSLGSPPRLLTFDHHTDTSEPFRDFLRREGPASTTDRQSLQSQWLNQIHFDQSETIRLALPKLGNDEHIVTAIRTGIISSALVVAHNAKDTDLITYREHRIICHAVGRHTHSAKILRADCDRVLESDFLREAVLRFDSILLAAGEGAVQKGPYILDIDLDYFNTRQSIEPVDANYFRTLGAGAGLITVATEPEYVEGLALDSGLSSEELLGNLRAYPEIGRG